MHQAAVLMHSPLWLQASGNRHHPAPGQIPARLFWQSLFWRLQVRVSRRAGRKGGKARVIYGTRGPEIVYDANMFKSTALPPLGKEA